jgi:AraC-like DNA-binding protein
LTTCDRLHNLADNNDPEQPIPEDYNFDFTWICPPDLGVGYTQGIDLRSGITLDIYNYRYYEPEDEIEWIEEREHPLEYAFYLGDRHLDRGRYGLWGSGLAPKEVVTDSNAMFQLNVHLEPEVFQSFIHNSTEGFPKNLQHLVRPCDRLYYHRLGITTPVMERVLRQILLCPYQGIVKRMYLEGKVMELMALLLEEELEAQQGKTYVCDLKPEELDRIHYARHLLLQQLAQPPSMEELARQVGLNEYILRKGFQQVFGKTVFSYLHEYRLKQARELITMGEMKISEIAAQVGFASRSYFASAFRKKFGMSPKAYQLSYKKSIFIKDF